ncbi:MAG: YbaN family protein [Bacteroidales bacterium]
MIKKIYILSAYLCVGLGIIGIFIPIMPTTPFLLVAIFLYMRSSKSGVKMILRNKYLAPYVYSYISKNGIPFKILLRTLLLLWGTLLIAAIFIANNIYIRLILLVVGVGVTIHLYIKRKK